MSRYINPINTPNLTFELDHQFDLHAFDRHGLCSDCCARILEQDWKRGQKVTAAGSGHRAQKVNSFEGFDVIVAYKVTQKNLYRVCSVHGDTFSDAKNLLSHCKNECEYVHGMRQKNKPFYFGNKWI